MSPEALLARARQVWVELAGSPIAFPERGVDVRASAASRLCPPGWAGVVVLGGAGIVTVPSADLVPGVSAALAGLPVDVVTEADELRARLPVAEVLGPASLAYLDEPEFRPADRQADIEELNPGHADLAALLAGVDPADAQECGLEEITSCAFVIRGPAGLVTAAGHRRWPGSVAHLSVLTAADHRGQGLARCVASAAVRDALLDHQLPQWRARPASSRQVARVLGFRHLGAQLSFRLE